MQCEMCGAKVEEEETERCASCGIILCPDCNINGLCVNCLVIDDF